MSTAVPPLPAEAAQPGLSEPQRIVNTFIAPSKTFEDIRRNASWWAPWLIMAIASLGVGSVLSKKVDWAQIVRQQSETGPGSAAFERLSPEQKEQRISIGAKIAGFVVYAVPIFSLIVGLVVAAVLMVAFNFGFAAEVPYATSLAIVFYGWLPELIRAIFALITLLLRTDTEGLNPNNLVGTNVAYFLDKANTSPFIYGMAGALDVISIWSIILIGIGFSVNSKARKLSQGAAIVTIVVLYLLIKLGTSALGIGS
jgi:Yip1 domain